MEQDCPDCGATEFRLIAKTKVHLGTKVKYHCEECDYGFVQIDGAVDTSPA